MDSTDVKTQVEGVRQIRRLLSAERDPPVKAVLEVGSLPRLVELLQAEDVKVQFESAWALTNIASTEYTKLVVESGAIPLLVAGMMSADANVREQSMWCIGNIAGDCPDLRDGLYSTPDCVNNLLLNIQHPESVGLLRNATWALSNFCRGKRAPSVDNAQQVLPALAYLICQEDSNVIADSMWGLNYLTEAEEAFVDVLLAYETILPRCVELLGHPDANVMQPAMRILGNVITGTAEQTQAAVDAGIMEALVPLLKADRANVRREACWTASNLAAGTHAQITRLLETPGLIDAVMEQVVHGIWNVQKEAIWVVCNIATAGNAAHVCQLVACKVIAPLVEKLSKHDEKIIHVVLDALNAILAVEKKLKDEGNPAAAICRFADDVEEAGGVNKLVELQESDNDSIYEKAKKIMAAYYEIDGDAAAEAESENAVVAAAPAPMAVAAAPKTFGFGAGPVGAGNAPAFGAIVPKAGVKAAPMGFGGPVAPAGGINFSAVSFS